MSLPISSSQKVDNLNKLSLPFAAERLVPILQNSALLAKDLVSRGSLKVEMKEDLSYVTNVDFAVHAFLAEKLTKLYDALIISEEDIPSAEVRKLHRVAWLFDPIDNTKGLVENSDLSKCSINVALLVDGEPVLAAVHYFEDDSGILSAKGVGAFRTRADQIEAINYEEIQAPLRYITYKKNLEDLAFPTRRIHELVAPEGLNIVVGEILPKRLKLLMLGEADVYIEPRRISEWDVVPAFANVLATGGSGISLETREIINFNSPTLKTSAFMLARNGVDVESILTRLSPLYPSPLSPLI